MLSSFFALLSCGSDFLFDKIHKKFVELGFQRDHVNPLIFFQIGVLAAFDGVLFRNEDEICFSVFERIFGIVVMVR